jgi:hypothetical protein
VKVEGISTQYHKLSNYVHAGNFVQHKTLSHQRQKRYCPIENKGYCPTKDKGYCPTEDKGCYPTEDKGYYPTEDKD